MRTIGVDTRQPLRELATSLRRRDCSVFVHVRRTQIHSPRAEKYLTVCGSLTATSKIKICPAQWSFFFFFEWGRHKPVDSQTSFQHSHTVFVTCRQKTTLLFTVQQRNTGNKPVQTQLSAATSCFEMFGILPT